MNPTEKPIENPTETPAEKSTENPRGRFVFIGLCVVLMAAAVYIIGQSVKESRRTLVRSSPVAESASAGMPLGERGGFQRADRALGYLEAPESVLSSRTRTKPGGSPRGEQSRP